MMAKMIEIMEMTKMMEMMEMMIDLEIGRGPNDVTHHELLRDLHPR